MFGGECSQNAYECSRQYSLSAYYTVEDPQKLAKMFMINGSRKCSLNVDVECRMYIGAWVTKMFAKRRCRM
jgi:hypothetical protein